MSILATGVATEAARQLKAEGAAVTPGSILKRARELMHRDREMYHGGLNGSQPTGTVGIEGTDGRLYCVGCWWCDQT